MKEPKRKRIYKQNLLESRWNLKKVRKWTRQPRKKVLSNLQTFFKNLQMTDKKISDSKMGNRDSSAEGCLTDTDVEENSDWIKMYEGFTITTN